MSTITGTGSTPNATARRAAQALHLSGTTQGYDAGVDDLEHSTTSTRRSAGDAESVGPRGRARCSRQNIETVGGTRERRPVLRRTRAATDASIARERRLYRLDATPTTRPTRPASRRSSATTQAKGATLTRIPWPRVHNRRQLHDWTIARDRGICWLCGRPGADTVDHVIPRALGGPDTLDNLRAAHRVCNSRRGTRLPTAPVTSRQW